ncbi:MAG TPA: ATP-binding protein, partial [Bryobacteraceae bacterium]|nr:ATP-binding protein [Bryobacteraceae bacterium]
GGGERTMSAQPAQNPYEANHAGLCRELERVYAALTGSRAIPPASSEGPQAMALARLCEVFRLSNFERDLLLLCAGCELEARFSEACASINNDPRSVWPTPSLAFSALGGAHWSAIGPEAPLRYWRLIEISSGAGLVRSPLRISERILHYLTGISCLDERLQPLVRRVESDGPANPARYAECAARAIDYWSSGDGGPRPLVLTGGKASGSRLVTEEIARLMNAPCFALRSADIPASAEERAQIARLWTRETLLTGAALFIRTGDMDAQESARIAAFLDAAWGPVAVEVREGADAGQIEGLRISIPPLSVPERRAVWEQSLGEVAAGMNGSLDRIADSFDLDPAAIRLAGGIVRESAVKGPESDPAKRVWEECRVQARASVESLAHRISPRTRWDDLILPETQKDTLRQIVAHVRHRFVVNGKWGFAEKDSRGLGVTALFAGVSGTGKTMAAEVIAAELELDLYQIDLSGVVSKYIGETEKNLRRIFDAAETSGAVLLFDEADALFGKRSEVKDSHDRYANLEVSYLLQRMEAYRGLAILTTNMKHALDQAFLRRIRFILQFPFPGPVERARIWERLFPSRTPVGQLDFARIAQLNVAGGAIRNIAVHAAFLAAAQGGEVNMDHILRAAKIEYAKLDRALTPAETGGWG